jgi:hypothetical protein
MNLSLGIGNSLWPVGAVKEVVVHVSREDSVRFVEVASELDMKLMVECDKSDKMSDKLLALECMARVLEKVALK